MKSEPSVGLKPAAARTLVGALTNWAVKPQSHSACDLVATTCDLVNEDNRKRSQMLVQLVSTGVNRRTEVANTRKSQIGRNKVFVHAQKPGCDQSGRKRSQQVVRLVAR